MPLAGCIDPAERAESDRSPLIRPPIINARPGSYECERSGRIVVRPLADDGSSIAISFADGEVQLKSIPVGEGLKYSDGRTTFYVFGETASLQTPGQATAENCERPD
jgi:membrane-bound inhibitor of C-type lysozyme